MPSSSFPKNKSNIIQPTNGGLRYLYISPIKESESDCSFNVAVRSVNNFTTAIPVEKIKEQR